MRTVSTFIATPSTIEPVESTVKTTFSPVESFQRSPWHSPAAYLFIGVAAMLGLIAFALVILACSYLKRSGETSDSTDDLESGAGEKSSGDLVKFVPIYEEKIVVIMAGDLNPTFLATPISSKSSSFGDENGSKIEKKLEMEDEELADENLSIGDCSKIAMAFAGAVSIRRRSVHATCSYWRRSGYPRENGDVESGDGEKSTGDVFKASPVFEEKIVVIMAGDLNPTFLATPISSRGNSFGAGDKIEKKLEKETEEFDDEKAKDEAMDQAHEESQIGH
uniref:Uncharacterized protein n=1 Tax=Solanum lycopersicum TaxID=4081 RepID=A0A3Q7JDT3_SOLLC